MMSAWSVCLTHAPKKSRFNSCGIKVQEVQKFITDYEYSMVVMFCSGRACAGGLTYSEMAELVSLTKDN
jgi:hypothetical protein